MKKLLILTLCTFPCLVYAQSDWTAPESAKKIENPLKKGEVSHIRGAQLFDLLCAVCHGETGRGDGVTLEYLNPKPANLTSERVQKQTDGEIYWKITTGRPPMQSYVNVLSTREIWQVIGFIRQLEDKSANSEE